MVINYWILKRFTYEILMTSFLLEPIHLFNKSKKIDLDILQNYHYFLTWMGGS